MRVQVVAITATVLLLIGVLELVRRRRLLERYALVWLFSALALLALGAWGGLLNTVATAIGIFYPPSALFVVAFGFILLLLLHFSVAVSRLTDQTKVLAQRLALLDERQRSVEETVGISEPRDVPAPEPEQVASGAPEARERPGQAAARR